MQQQFTVYIHTKYIQLITYLKNRQLESQNQIRKKLNLNDKYRDTEYLIKAT